MEARTVRVSLLLAAFVFLPTAAAQAASYRTANFVVEAPTPELAEKIGKAAEVYRRDLAISWVGKAMPNWSRPCPIVAEVSPNLGAGGKTSFVFNEGQVFGWDMNIQGSEERVLDSVLPHEVTHTIFASYFRRPLPRWADEGACTTVEHSSERKKQQVMLINFLRTDHGIAFDKLFAMKEYPRDVLPLYSEGYSLARFLIDQGGRQKFMEFVGEGMKTDNWPATLKKDYGFDNLQALQDNWLAWVQRGSPPSPANIDGTILAANDRATAQNSAPNFRAQSDDRESPVAGAKSVSASSDRGWTADNRASASDADSQWTSVGGSRADRNSASAAARPSVYDRRSSAGASANSDSTPPPAPTPPNNSTASNPPFVSAPPPGPAIASSDNRLRDPEYLARRDGASTVAGSATAASDHKVLLEWRSPQ